MSTFLQRYHNGEHEQVWAELQALGGAVRQEPVLTDALAVARETMTRARENIMRLVPRLHEIGYQFNYPDEIVMLPNTSMIDPVAWLEHHAGPLPLSLRAWYELVGGVDFMGAHPAWEDAYPDPLVVFSVELAVQEYQDWRQWHDDEGAAAAGPFAITVAPDLYQKANAGGGDPYQIGLPNAAADAPLAREWHATTFVSYLRTCFRWGGFPGLARAERPPHEHLAYLTENLLPL